MPKEKSAGAVIFMRDKNETFYLLLDYTKKYSDFPKGHIEAGESEEATVIREVREETGISDLVIIKGFRESIKYFFKATYGLSEVEKKKAPWVFKSVVFYLAETRTKEVKISSEHIGYKWLNFNEASRMLKHKNAKEILAKAHNFLAEIKRF